MYVSERKIVCIFFEFQRIFIESNLIATIFTNNLIFLNYLHTLNLKNHLFIGNIFFINFNRLLYKFIFTLFNVFSLRW